MREHHRRYLATLERIKAERAALEKEAKSLEIDFEGKSLRDLLITLNHRREFLESVSTEDTGAAFNYFLREGITDHEEMIARLDRYADELRLVEKQIEVVYKLGKVRPDVA